MDYLESTMETLVFGILICNSNVQYQGQKMHFAMSEIKYEK